MPQCFHLKTVNRNLTHDFGQHSKTYILHICIYIYTYIYIIYARVSGTSWKIVRMPQDEMDYIRDSNMEMYTVGFADGIEWSEDDRTLAMSCHVHSFTWKVSYNWSNGSIQETHGLHSVPHCSQGFVWMVTSIYFIQITIYTSCEATSTYKNSPNHTLDP